MKRLLILTFCTTLFYVSPASAGNVYSTLIDALKRYKSVKDMMCTNVEKLADSAKKRWEELSIYENDLRKQLNELPDTPQNQYKRSELDGRLRSTRQQMEAQAEYIIYGGWSKDYNCRKIMEELEESIDNIIFAFKKLRPSEMRDVIGNVKTLLASYPEHSHEYRELLKLLSEMEKIRYGID